MCLAPRFGPLGDSCQVVVKPKLGQLRGWRYIAITQKPSNRVGQFGASGKTKAVGVRHMCRCKEPREADCKVKFNSYMLAGWFA